MVDYVRIFMYHSREYERPVGTGEALTKHRNRRKMFAAKIYFNINFRGLSCNTMESLHLPNRQQPAKLFVNKCESVYNNQR